MFPPNLRAAGTYYGTTAARPFSEADAAPQLGSWWILMVLMLAIMTSIAAAALIMLSHVVNAVLSIVWQT